MTHSFFLNETDKVHTLENTKSCWHGVKIIVVSLPCLVVMMEY